MRLPVCGMLSIRTTILSTQVLDRLLKTNFRHKPLNFLSWTSNRKPVPQTILSPVAKGDGLSKPTREDHACREALSTGQQAGGQADIRVGGYDGGGLTCYNRRNEGCGFCR